MQTCRNLWPPNNKSPFSPEAILPASFYRSPSLITKDRFGVSIVYLLEHFIRQVDAINFPIPEFFPIGARIIKIFIFRLQKAKGGTISLDFRFVIQPENDAILIFNEEFTSRVRLAP